jgi:uncharacterized membrane protein
MRTNSWLRVILVLWVVGFLIISCGPAFAGDGIVGTLAGGAIGLVLGSVLLVPWLMGLAVLLVLIWLTNDRGRARYPGDRDRR